MKERPSCCSDGIVTLQTVSLLILYMRDECLPQISYLAHFSLIESNTFPSPTAESYSGKGKYLKRIRYHGRGMFGIMDKVYCHYFVKLVEGAPPKTERTTSFDQAKQYVQNLKNRTIIHSL